jgi:hypothetical protein
MRATPADIYEHCLGVVEGGHKINQDKVPVLTSGTQIN